MNHWQPAISRGAKEVCKSTPGPTASVLYEGLRNASGGPEAGRKSHRIIWVGSDGSLRERSGMDFTVYRHCTDAWFHGYSYWYDSGI